MTEMPIKKNLEAARQGETGRTVRYVLIGGLVLVLVAFALIYLFGR